MMRMAKYSRPVMIAVVQCTWSWTTRVTTYSEAFFGSLLFLCPFTWARGGASKRDGAEHGGEDTKGWVRLLTDTGIVEGVEDESKI